MDIYERLLNGENPDEIAQEFADSLNAALDKYKSVTGKQDWADSLARNINDFLHQFYPEVKDITGKEFIKICETYKTIYQVMPLLEDALLEGFN